MQYISEPISELDYLVILRVKQLRIDRNMSQRSLSVDMKLSKSFVGKVEALGQPEKYSVRHLWLIKDALKLEDIKDIFEGISVKHDLIEIVYEKIPKLNKDGKESKQFDEKVIEIRPIPKEDKGEKM